MWFTPITNIGASPDGALITTFLAPPCVSSEQSPREQPAAGGGGRKTGSHPRLHECARLSVWLESLLRYRTQQGPPGVPLEKGPGRETHTLSIFFSRRTFMCADAASMDVNTPVDSTTYSAPTVLNVLNNVLNSKPYSCVKQGFGLT
jgi:hypothetical protein